MKLKSIQFPTTQISYEVVFVPAVDNPVDNVRRERLKGHCRFFVPVNHPTCSHLGFIELSQAANRKELLDSSTALNNTVDSSEKTE